MKNKICVLCAAILFLPGLARAEEKTKFDFKKAGIGLALFAPAFFTNTVIHESAHALAVPLRGAKVIKFVVWPNRDDGGFTWGYVNWRKRETTPADLATISISPQIANFMVFTATELLFATEAVSSNSYAGLALFVFGEVAPWVNFFQFLSSSSDIKEFEKATGVNIAVTRGVGGAIALAGLYVMIRRAHKIFWKRSVLEKNRKYNIGFLADGGVSFGMKF